MAYDSLIPFVRLDATLVGEQQCYDVWREELRAIYDLSPVGDAPAGTERVSAWLLGNLIFTDVTFSSQAFRHDTNHTRDSNWITLQIFKRGGAKVLFADSPAAMVPGQVHIFDMSREYYAIAENSDIASVIIPHEAIGYDPRYHPPHLSFPEDSPIGQFLKNVFFALLGQLSELHQEETKAISAGFCGLLQRVLAPGSPEESEGQKYRAERRAAMRAYLDGHLSDPEIGMDQLSRIFNASRSSIYRDFAEMGGVGQYIAQRRLDQIFRQLLSTPPSRGRVQEIASSWGFEDPGYFSRLFRQRFGVPPSNAFVAESESPPPFLPRFPDFDQSLSGWLKTI